MLHFVLNSPFRVVIFASLVWKQNLIMERKRVICIQNYIQYFCVRSTTNIEIRDLRRYEFRNL